MKRIICFKILILLLSSISLFCHDYKGLFLRYDRLSPYTFVESATNQLDLSICSRDSTKMIKEIQLNNLLLSSFKEKNEPESMILNKQISRNQLMLNIESIKPTNLKIYITDLLGNLLIQKGILTNYGLSEYSINLSGLNNGLYTLNVFNENTKYTFLFIYLFVLITYNWVTKVNS